MGNKKICNVYKQSSRYRLEFDFSEGAIEELKRIIQWPTRRYDDELRAWYITFFTGVDAVLRKWADKWFDKTILHMSNAGVKIEYDFITMKKEVEWNNLFEM